MRVTHDCFKFILAFLQAAQYSLPPPPLSPSLRICIDVCMLCVHIYVGVCASGDHFDVMCLRQLLSTMFFETGSLIERRSYQLASLAASKL